MDIIETQQLLTVGGFLALLVAAMFFVQANRGKLTGRIAQGRRMQLAEVTALGPDARAMLLNIDGKDFLVVTSKRQAPVVTPLEAASEVPTTLARIAA